MDQNDAHWKQKYLTSLDKYEKKEKSWKQLEELLRLGMNRVALAAQGVDATLDRQLKVLRKSIRSGAYNGLESIVEEISASVKRLDEMRQEQERIGNQPQAVVLNLINALQFPKSYKSQVKGLLNQVKNAEPEHALDDVLRQLAGLINTLVASHAASTTQATAPDSTQAPGLLQRWLNPSAASQAQVISLQLASEILDSLLQSLRAASIKNSEVDSLLARLRQAQDDKDIWRICHEISHLLPHSLSAFAEGSHTQTQTGGFTADSTPSANPTTVQDDSLLTRDGVTQSVSRQATDAFPATARAHTTQPSASQPSVAGFCLQLIETLQFPADFDDTVQTLRDSIVTHYEANAFDLAHSAQVLNDIAGLITATRNKLEQEKQDLQEFLRQLTDRLKDIDQHLAGAESHSKQSISSRLSFGDMVEAQMKGIESSVQDAAELNQLKSLVQDRLDAIRTHIVTYQQSEEKTQRDLLDALAASNARLHDMEMETEQLRARLMQEHAQAIHDKLTGIYNRLAYEERMAQEIERWKRYKQPLVLLVFDVDHFKSINDTYGHRAGDKALKLIAQTLQKNIRATDFLARYGGEEFVVLMPETDISAAMGVANKLRESVQAIHFNYQEKALSVTISCGATQLNKGDTPERAFQRADGFLYQAKQQGRNRCITQDKISD